MSNVFIWKSTEYVLREILNESKCIFSNEKINFFNFDFFFYISNEFWYKNWYKTNNIQHMSKTIYSKWIPPIWRMSKPIYITTIQYVQHRSMNGHRGVVGQNQQTQIEMIMKHYKDIEISTQGYFPVVISTQNNYYLLQHLWKSKRNRCKSDRNQNWLEIYSFSSNKCWNWTLEYRYFTIRVSYFRIIIYILLSKIYMLSKLDSAIVQ